VEETDMASFKVTERSFWCDLSGFTTFQMKLNIHGAEIQTANYHVRIRGTTVKEERRSVNGMKFIPFEAER
jgi:hypothetical protein